MRLYLLIAERGKELVETFIRASPDSVIEVAEIFAWVNQKADLLLIEEVAA